MTLDIEAVSTWLQTAAPGVQTIENAKRLVGGQSNPTYLLETGAGPLVLRRKPSGTLLKSAHAVDREYRVQSALAKTGVPVARMVAYCDDPKVIGSAFYVMAFVPGRSFDDPILPEVSKHNKKLYFNEMAGVLAAIHRVDIDEVGLSDFGPRGSYVRRQIDRWTKQYRATETEPLPDMDRLIATLDARCPEDDGRLSLVHGDYRLDNLMFDVDRPEIVAVLDWELSTLGHPFADLASVLMQWRMPPGADGRGLAGIDRAVYGLPSDDDFVAEYCTRARIEKPSNIEVYVAFCFFRMAAILQGVKRRALDGNASDPERGLKLGALVPAYAKGGLEALDG